MNSGELGMFSLSRAVDHKISLWVSFHTHGGKTDETFTVMLLG